MGDAARDDERTMYIYALCEPDDPARVRYIGKSHDIAKRMVAHYFDARSKRPYWRNARERWLIDVLHAGKKPHIRILETTTPDKADEREQAQIAAHHANGHALTNSAYLERPNPKRKRRPAVEDAPDALLTPAEAAQRRGVEVPIIRQAVKAGRIPVVRLQGERYRLRVADVDALALASRD